MKSIKQFFWMSGTMVMLLTGMELFKGRPLEDALPFAFGWGLLSAGIFAGSRYVQARRGIACAVCKDDTK